MGLLWDNSAVAFLVVTVVLGGGAAWLTGRAMALDWRGLASLLGAMALLGLFVRFIHFALADGTLLSAHYYIVDTLVLMGIAALGFTFTRARQMVRQYPWLYRRTGPLTWAARDSTDS